MEKNIKSVPKFLLFFGKLKRNDYFCNPISCFNKDNITTKNRIKDEKNISTAQSSSREQAWFPRAYGNEEWSPCVGFTPRKGTQEADCF